MPDFFKFYLKMFASFNFLNKSLIKSYKNHILGMISAKKQVLTISNTVLQWKKKFMVKLYNIKHTCILI